MFVAAVVLIPLLEESQSRPLGLTTPRHRRGLSTDKKRDPAVAHAQREAVRQNWNPFAFDVSLNSPYLWGAAACVALVATAYDEAETDEQRRRREEGERRKRVEESLAALRRKE
mgnify:CR=1 FL=1